MTIRLRIRRPYGDIEIEEDTFDKIVENLKSVPEWLGIIDDFVSSASQLISKGTPLDGLIEPTAEGPTIIVPKGKIIDKEAIGLLLYASDPKPLEPKEVIKLLNMSGRASTGFAARLNELRKEGRVLKEGRAYKLTSIGKRWIEEELISKLKP